MQREEYLEGINLTLIAYLENAILLLRSQEEKETTVGQFTELCSNIVRSQWENGRQYHTPLHLFYMLQHLDLSLQMNTMFEETQYSLKDKGILIIAIIMHDYVYDPRNKKGQNETASMNFVRSLFKNIIHDHYIEVIQSLIELTIEHTNPAKVVLGDIFIDADLAILSEPYDRYLQYVVALFNEYFVTLRTTDRLEAIKIFYAGRQAWTEEFLARPKLYMQKDDTLARKNLETHLTEINIFTETIKGNSDAN